MLEGSKAFFLEGSSREAVLCLHGFSGSPGIYRKIGPVLHQEGLTVYAPCLPGHGTIADDLRKVTNEQFVRASEDAFSLLAGKYDKVHLIGLSLGGTLATLLASRHAEYKSLGCVSLLSPGYGFNQMLAVRIGISAGAEEARRASKMIPLPQRKPSGDEVDECIFGYGAVPLVCFDRLQALNLCARDARSLVKAPVLLLYAGNDAVVDASVSAGACGVFPCLDELLCFEQSEHNLLLGSDRQEVISRCVAFIAKHRVVSL